MSVKSNLQCTVRRELAGRIYQDLIGARYAEDVVVATPDDIRASVALPEYAVECRYPGFDEPVTEEQWHEAISIGVAVLEWSREVISRKV